MFDRALETIWPDVYSLCSYPNFTVIRYGRQLLYTMSTIYPSHSMIVSELNGDDDDDDDDDQCWFNFRKMAGVIGNLTLTRVLWFFE